MQTREIVILKHALLLFIILAWSHNASAYQCLNKQTGETISSGSSNIVVPLNKFINIGETTFFDLSQYFQCRNMAPVSYIDFMETRDNALATSLPGAFKVSAYINGASSGIPVPRENIFKLTDGDYHSLPVKIAYQVADSPGKIAQIKKGDVIATLQLHKYAYLGHSTMPIDPVDFQWNIIAENDATLTSGSCEINGGNTIDVNFSVINNKNLSSSATQTILKKTVTIPYKCNNPVSMPVSIYLSAVPADFSSDTISTTNKNIGIKMLYQGEVIEPAKGLKTNLVRGMGSSQLDFVLVKKQGADVENGPFEGSAVLIMTAD